MGMERVMAFVNRAMSGRVGKNGSERAALVSSKALTVRQIQELTKFARILLDDEGHSDPTFELVTVTIRDQLGIKLSSPCELSILEQVLGYGPEEEIDRPQYQPRVRTA